ncbi:MAG: glycosyltransferase family 4 protein [Saprospiraceae bacterium]|nr:glycosyltransferase family 4 protein [Saprospiraceae bacterium]
MADAIKPIILKTSTIQNSLWKIYEDQLAFLNEQYRIHAVSAPGQLLEIVAEREGVITHGLPMTRAVNPLLDLISLWRWIVLLRKVKPTIIHAHSPKAGLLSMIAGNITRVPIKLYTIAGIPFESYRGWRRWILQVIERMTYGLADKVYPNSLGHAAYLAEKKLIRPQKMSVLGEGSTNGIDLQYFKRTEEVVQRGEEQRKNLGILPGHFVFLYISRLVKHKGAEEMLLSFDRLHQRHPNTRLVICGRMVPNAPNLSKEAQAVLANNPAVMFTGYHEDVRPFYALADAFAFPSQREGLPNVLLQAGAMELPIVCSDILGNTDVIEDGVNGVLVQAQSVEDTVRGMRLLLEDKDLRIQLASTVRETIASRYDRKALLKAYLEEYEELLSTIEW